MSKAEAGVVKSVHSRRRRILFAPRGESDFERFVAIARHLTAEADLAFVRLAGEVGPPASAHRRLLGMHGYSIVPWNELVGCVRGCASGEPDEQGIERVLEMVKPDLVVLDQFGPTCARAIISLRDTAMKRCIATCMIPHGVRMVDRRHAQPQPQVSSGKPSASAVFYTSGKHEQDARPFYEADGTTHHTMGDPRLDQGHLEDLGSVCRTIAATREPGMRRVAYFGSNLEPTLLQAIGALNPDCDSQTLELYLLAGVRLLVGSSEVRHRPHPKVSADRPSMEGYELSVWSDIAVSPCSSAVLEGLVMGRPIVLVDIGSVAPNFRTLLECSDAERVNGSCPLPLLRLAPPADEFLERFCWAGNGRCGVARAYAGRLLSLAGG
jgi:hypothetical protein